jgi:DNA-binding GntR family transcriptional regulator
MTDLSVLGPVSASGAPTLVDGIQASLRDAIARGALPAGFRLREIPLAEYFGCSTTPVREAIRKLEHEGLVKVYARRGAEVTSVTMSEVEHLYETRIVLECYATRKAAERRPTAEQLANARATLEAQQQHVQNQPDEGSPLDADFHREITALCGNPMIAQLVERATRQIEAVQARNGSYVRGGEAQAAKAHAAILKAVAAGQADRAEVLMRKHLEWASSAVMESLDGSIRS